ncbi:hypothetical protein A33M_3473 [Rhodovulum sp. PH10]|nr:hypothetical protein A33M_3473 [Rhodovulum sp. PH10]
MGAHQRAHLAAVGQESVGSGDGFDSRGAGIRRFSVCGLLFHPVQL